MFQWHLADLMGKASRPRFCSQKPGALRALQQLYSMSDTGTILLTLMSICGDCMSLPIPATTCPPDAPLTLLPDRFTSWCCLTLLHLLPYHTVYAVGRKSGCPNVVVHAGTQRAGTIRDPHSP